MIDVSDGGESKEDGQKVASGNTEVTNCSSRVKRIEAGTIWPRKEDEERRGMRGTRTRRRTRKWLKGKDGEEEEGVEGLLPQ